MANFLFSNICSASTDWLWNRWGCMWLHMCGNHQNSFTYESSRSSPRSSSSDPGHDREGGTVGAEAREEVEGGEGG